MLEFIKAARRMRIGRDPRDVKLSRMYLEPVKAQLLALACRRRREVDAILRAESHNQALRLGEYFEISGETREYPVGYCRQIRDRVWEKLSDDTLIRNLRGRGLTWKKVYFIQDGREFQNAIQAGDWLLDAAHDTTDPARESVVLSPLSESAWENLDDWRRFVEVSEAYHRVKVYPNLYFPLLFPMMPFLAVRETGRLEFLYCQQMLFFLDLGDNWRRLRAALEDPDLMNRVLPPAVESRVLALAGLEADPFPVEVRKCAVDELAETPREWEQVQTLSKTHAAATFRNYEKLAALAARKLCLANIHVEG